MKLSALPRWPWLALATALALGLLSFFYTRTSSYGDIDYFEDAALLRHLKQLDAQWELDVLRSRLGINPNYDPLANSLVQLDSLTAQLKQHLQTHASQGSGAYARAGDALSAAIAEKAALIEQFKSHNAVLRNSQAFMPTAADDMRQLLASGVGDTLLRQRMAVQVDEVLLASVLFSQTPTPERSADVLGRLAALRSLLPHDAPELASHLAVLDLHARAMLREQGTVEQLLGAIASVPTSARIDALHTVRSDEKQGSEKQGLEYRLYLMAFACLLVALLLYTATRLVIGHTTIRRMNAELKLANDTLEQRVQSRTAELRTMQGALVSSARVAGMAEVATNVLHNVGNVLNSVNISAGLVAAQLRGSRLGGMARAVRMMDDHTDDLGLFLTQDARGRLLPAYLRELVPALEAEHRVMAGEMAALNRSVDHIKQVIATQQSYAGKAPFLEEAPLDELMDEALRMNADALERGQVRVVRHVVHSPALPLDRHRLVQVLVNLVRNAAQALDAAAVRAPCITLDAMVVDNGLLRIAVADNGEGIAPENLQRIFAHGFTTRPGGHGFGLHSCAIAAREMGGVLKAGNGTHGPGAIFTLEIPLKTPVATP